jgi:large subunit ribosomal protein L18
MLAKFASRLRRHIRIRAKVSGTEQRPRLAVYRSNANIYAQLIDDTSGKTLGQSSDLKITSGTKMEKAVKVWEAVAKIATDLKIKEVVFDTGWFKYHGRVKSLADWAREAGLKF